MDVSTSKKDGGCTPQVWQAAVRRQGSVIAVLAFLIGLLSACQPEVAQRSQVSTKQGPLVSAEPTRQPGCELRDYKEGAKFVTEAWAVPDEKFNIGEPLRLQMRVSSPTYMNVFHVSTSCKVTRLVYNKSMVEGEIVDFPAQDIQVTVKPPPGEEAFYFVATRAELKVFAQADILRGVEIASLDLTPEEFFVRLDQASGRINPDDLSITTLRTTVVRH